MVNFSFVLSSNTFYSHFFLLQIVLFYWAVGLRVSCGSQLSVLLGICQVPVPSTVYFKKQKFYRKYLFNLLGLVMTESGQLIGSDSDQKGLNPTKCQVLNQLNLKFTRKQIKTIRLARFQAQVGAESGSEVDKSWIRI